MQTIYAKRSVTLQKVESVCSSFFLYHLDYLLMPIPDHYLLELQIKSPFAQKAGRFIAQNTKKQKSLKSGKKRITKQS